MLGELHDADPGSGDGGEDRGRSASAEMLQVLGLMDGQQGGGHSLGSWGRAVLGGEACSEGGWTLLNHCLQPPAG